MTFHKIIFLLSILALNVCNAQSLEVVGQFLQLNCLPIVDAEVLINKNDTMIQSTKTDSTGQFVIYLDYNVKYQIFIYKKGFKVSHFDAYIKWPHNEKMEDWSIDVIIPAVEFDSVKMEYEIKKPILNIYYSKKEKKPSGKY